jgi:hypothetical protein
MMDCWHRRLRSASRERTCRAANQAPVARRRPASNSRSGRRRSASLAGVSSGSRRQRRHEAVLGPWSCHAGPTVRIRLPPATLLRTHARCARPQRGAVLGGVHRRAPQLRYRLDSQRPGACRGSTRLAKFQHVNIDRLSRGMHGCPARKMVFGLILASAALPRRNRSTIGPQ